jgi:hypothetical protein
VKVAAAGVGTLMTGRDALARAMTRGATGSKSVDLDVRSVDQIPQVLLRLAGLGDLPALPIDLPQVAESVPKLLKRLEEQEPAKAGLSNIYTIAGETGTGREFLFGDNRPDRLREALDELQTAIRANPAGLVNELYRDLLDRDKPSDPKNENTDLTGLSLETPEHWTISWTNFQEVYERAQPLLPRWAATMTDVTVAAEEFWPTIARYGAAYNLLVLRKLTPDNDHGLRQKLGDAWTADLSTIMDEGRLYAIDMSIFESVRSNVVHGFERFTPASMTLLEQDAVSKAMRPILILVSGDSGAGLQIYTPATATPSAWLYAMLAAKTSITVYGIWLGHVYPWHIVTAAMLMTMYNELPRSHPVHQLLAPQADFLFGFDDILLLVWRRIAPPTSVSTPRQFLYLLNEFGRDRPFAADDPKQAIADLGLDIADFTTDPATPWDRYPMVGYLLEIWDAAEAYVGAVMDESYRTDREVQRDRHLQSWLSASANASEGNIAGLPEVSTKEALAGVLTSLIYRITVHGISRMASTANPALTFLPNFPPCLQNATIPDPGADFDTETLLSYLPRTGTIGLMLTFYFTFVFSAPYVPFIPEGGVEADLFYPGGVNDPRNQALIRFRQELMAFLDSYQPDNPQLHQWPRNIET